MVTTWISKLLDLQKQYGVCATITTFAPEMSFERLETDEEYQNRIEREDYLGQIKIKDAEFRFVLALLRNLTSKHN